jgi:protein O-GlcNAc transferase
MLSKSNNFRAQPYSGPQQSWFSASSSCRFHEAAASFRRAIASEPRLVEARHNLLFVLNYDPLVGSTELFREYEVIGEFISDLKTPQFSHEKHAPVSGRRIRVGYSSPDFRGHACRFFMEPIFRNHDRDQFELFAYSNTANPDDHTERMKGHFDHWIDVVPMS